VARTAAPLRPGAFFGSVERQWKSSLVTLSHVRHREGRSVPEHAHEHAFATLLLRGGYEEVADGRRIVYAPMGLVYHPPGLVHRDTIADGGADFFTIELAPALWSERRARSGGLASVRDLSGGPPVWAMLRLYRDLAAFAPSVLDFEEPAAEMVADLSRAWDASRPAAREPSWLGAVDDALERRFAGPLSLAELAAVARVPPVHLSRVYRARRGCSLRETLRRVRVSEACRLLLEGRPLAEVALATGFSDQSHFTNVFRRVTGSTPAATRRLLAGRGGAAARTPRRTGR
jgi:AraC family transcriptional regulator